MPFEQQINLVTVHEAVENIYRALETNGTAYGLDATRLSEWLIDAILNDDAAVLEMLKRCKDIDVVRRMCECIANDY